MPVEELRKHTSLLGIYRFASEDLADAVLDQFWWAHAVQRSIHFGWRVDLLILVRGGPDGNFLLFGAELPELRRSPISDENFPHDLPFNRYLADNERFGWHLHQPKNFDVPLDNSLLGGRVERVLDSG